jgi:hypothetical protein
MTKGLGSRTSVTLHFTTFSIKGGYLPNILQGEVEKAIKEMRDKKATGDDDVPGDVLKIWEKMVTN